MTSGGVARLGANISHISGMTMFSSMTACGSMPDEEYGVPNCPAANACFARLFSAQLRSHGSLSHLFSCGECDLLIGVVV